jgi:hypothetical protein
MTEAIASKHPITIPDAILKHSSQYKCAIVDLALIRQDNQNHIIRGRIVFDLKEPGESRITKYNEIEIHHVELSPEKGFEFIESLINSNSWKEIDGLSKDKYEFQGPILTPHPDYPAPIGYNGRENSWPSTFYLLKRSSSIDRIRRGPLLDVKQPPIIDLNAHFDNLIHFQSHWYFDTQQSVLIQIPDYRARIAKIRLNPVEVKVEIESKCISLENILTQVVLKPTDSSEYVYPQITQRDNNILIPLKQSIDGLYCFIFDKQRNEIIDWAQIHSPLQELPPGVEFDVPEQQIQVVIENGEGQTVEFKSEATPFPIIQSIVAFANTNAGWIIIGVDDQARIVGINALETQKKIEEWIYKQCDPPININYRIIDWSNGKQILILEVPLGSNRPYSHRENGAFYIRRGATDRAMRRSELDAIYGQKTPNKPMGW